MPGNFVVAAAPITRRSMLCAVRNPSHLLRVAVVLAVSGCHDCGDEPPEDHDPDPPVYTVEIIPSPVAARINEKFSLRVRLKDAHGHLIPRDVADAVVWTATPSAAVLPNTPQTGESATFVLLSGDISVSASVNGRSDKAEITGVVGDSDAHDAFATSHEAGEPPRILLTDGMKRETSGDRWVNDELAAVVRNGAFGPYVNAPDQGEITMFSAIRQATRTSIGWSNGPDRINFASGVETPSDRIQVEPQAGIAIPVTIWILASISDEDVDRDIDYAQRILDQSWSGVTLTVTKERRAETGLTLSSGCPGLASPYSIRGQLETAGVTGFSPDIVTIAYVQRTFAAGVGVEEGVWPGPTGRTCIWNASDGSVGIVNAAAKVLSTFAHEIGHSLGWLNHVQYGEGLDESNLMWFQPEYVPAPRARLTIGQSYRFTFDSQGSFAQLSTLIAPIPITCPQFGLSDTPCPRLNRDVQEP